jgi:hypothetical protein
MKNICNLLLLSIGCSLNLFAAKGGTAPETVPPAIMQIDSYKECGGITTITLNNGMCWEYMNTGLFSALPGDPPCNNPANLWKVGDRVHIVYTFTEGRDYVLQNVSYPGAVPAKLTNADAATITATRIRTLSKSGPPGGRTCTIGLDDGTMWYVGWWCSPSLEEWQEGDRVICSPHDFIYNQHSFLMINLDRPASRNELRDHDRADLTLNPHAKPAREDPNLRPGRVWKLIITKIQKTGDGYLVELSNKMVWLSTQKAPIRVWLSAQDHPQNSSKDQKYVCTSKTFDCVSFDTCGESFIMQNCRDSSSVLATLTNPTANIAAQTIYSLSGDEARVVLDDGSVWNFAEDKKSWKVGDRIVVSPLQGLQVDANSHLLMNLSRTDADHNLVDSVRATLIR